MKRLLCLTLLVLSVEGQIFDENREPQRVKDPFEPPIWERWEEDQQYPQATMTRKKNPMTFWPETPTSAPPLGVPDPNHQGYLKDIGAVNVGFGVGVGVPGNDPVSIGARVGVDLGESGLAGGVPVGQDIFPRRGEAHSLNDYDGNKLLILPDKATKYIQAVREGKIRLVKFQQPKTLVGVNGGVGVGG